ncbi:PREDICTED: uncharacterized protein LOC109161622 [Ipomoea nil]|uniref:uncharacterized protein LOC109161622 n=1 Tax=Ipomoea nil TaxID=35883 RepID=UPI00090090BD|nr:PREDICTED: uncharacterized protein LOC109161622 [Ipomoea nil]
MSWASSCRIPSPSETCEELKKTIDKLGDIAAQLKAVRVDMEKNIKNFAYNRGKSRFRKEKKQRNKPRSTRNTGAETPRISDVVVRVPTMNIMAWASSCRIPSEGYDEELKKALCELRAIGAGLKAIIANWDKDVKILAFNKGKSRGKSRFQKKKKQRNKTRSARNTGA